MRDDNDCANCTRKLKENKSTCGQHTRFVLTYAHPFVSQLLIVRTAYSNTLQSNDVHEILSREIRNNSKPPIVKDVQAKCQK